MLSSAVPRETLEGYEGFRGLEGLTASFEVERGAVREFSRKALDGLPVVDLTIEEIPLEEGIAELYRSEVIGG